MATVRCERSSEVLAVVDLWYRLRWGESCGWAGDREYEYALSLIDAHGLDEVVAIMPRAVALTRVGWPEGRTLSAVRRYWSQAMAERTRERLEVRQQESERERRERLESDRRERERQERRREGRQVERWESLSDAERVAIRQHVRAARPSLDPEGRTFFVLCLAEMDRRGL